MIDGGKAVCEFPAYEGRVWDPITSSYSFDVEGDYGVEGNTMKNALKSGAGAIWPLRLKTARSPVFMMLL